MADAPVEQRQSGDWAPDGASTRRYLEQSSRLAEVEQAIVDLIAPRLRRPESRRTDLEDVVRVSGFRRHVAAAIYLVMRASCTTLLNSAVIASEMPSVGLTSK